MPDPRRFQRRRPEQSGLGLRLVLGVVAAIAVIFLAKMMFRGQGQTQSSGTNLPPITLINDVLNTNASTTNTNDASITNTNASTNTNIATNTNISASSVASAKTVCPKPFSQFGTAKQMALTFDVSADNENTVSLIQTLKDESVPATFFVSGSFADAHPEIVKAIGLSFEVGNHGYDVQSYSSLTSAQAASQISKGATAITSALDGGNVAPFFRPPYGDTSDVLTKAATDAGDCTVLWTVDAFDWQNGQTVAGATQRTVEKFRSGAILLLHAGYDITSDAAKAIISEGRSAGYTFVSMSDLTGLKIQ